MRSTLSTIFALFLASFSLTAQNFEISYDNQYSPYVWAQIDQTADGGYIAAGRGDFDFIKVDALGQFQWGYNSQFAGADNSDGGGVMALDDGTMILSGEINGNTGGSNVGYLTKVDANGQEIWYDPVVGAVQAMSPGINGNFFIMRGCCNGTFQVQRVNANGALGWSRYFHAIQSVLGTSDGGVIAAGESSGMHHVRKYDEYGDLVWSWTGTNDTFNGINNLLDAVEGDNGNIYLGGSINDNGTKAYLLELDASGNLANEFIFPFGSFIQSIAKKSNGNFIIGGRKGSAFIAEINPSADILWERRINGNRVHDAQVTADGGVVALVSAGNIKITKTDAQGIVFDTYISGSIILDQEGDCQLQNTDVPATTTVIATSTTTGKKFYATSASDGTYLLDCEVSNYEISTSLPSDQEPCEPTLIGMLANIQVHDAGPKLYKYNGDPQGTILGQVYIDNNGNCEFDEGDVPLECIRPPFTWEGEIDPIFYGETDQNGYFEFEAPADIHYFPYGFSFGLWGASTTSGCLIGGEYLAAYDTMVWNYALAPGINTPAYISGYVYIDENENCEFEANEIPTGNFKVGISEVGSSDTISINPLNDGYYAAILEAGTYEVFIQLEGNPNWTSCDTSVTITANTTCLDLVDIPLQALEPCSDFSVSIATSLFRICQENTIFVNYQNIGTAAGTATIEVILDTLLLYNSGSIEPVQINGDTLTYEIGPLEPLAVGSFNLSAALSCDAVLGETHCLEARIEADNPCELFTNNWDGSSVKLTGTCVGDDLSIKIENVGDNAMSQERNYIVIEDNILLNTTPFQLDIGESLSFNLTPDGASILITAEQSANHPFKSMPARSFEGCGVNNQGTFSLGYITQYPQDDINPDVSIFCMENVNSYDPNDKQGFPRGMTEEKYIAANTQLEYMIRFQNTGTAPAFDVLIADPISTALDHTSIRPGASSHDYTYSMNNGVAEFKFENINLPDSTTNLEASQGFVTFTIDQHPDNQPGTEILNNALIYFDTNNPILTNQTVHRIPYPQIEETQGLDLCESDYDPDSLYTETVEYLFFENVITYAVNLLPEYTTEITTPLHSGEMYEGVAYYHDTLLIDNYQTITGCDSTVYNSIEILTSTVQLTLDQLIISPNPTFDLINIAGLENIDPQTFSIHLYDQMGRLQNAFIQMNKKNGLIQIDLSDLASGIYLLNIAGQVERVVKL